MISRTPDDDSRPRRDPDTKLGRDSWQCLTILRIAYYGREIMQKRRSYVVYIYLCEYICRANEINMLLQSCHKTIK